MIHFTEKVPAFFHSRLRNRDGRTVWRCDLCQGGEFLSVRHQALGKLHRENNHQDDLDAMAATARLQELPFFTRLNIDDEISLQDLIDAELEEILRQEDAAMFDGPGHQEEEVDPAEAAKWFPFNNKMVSTRV